MEEPRYTVTTERIGQDTAVSVPALGIEFVAEPGADIAEMAGDAIAREVMERLSRGERIPVEQPVGIADPRREVEVDRLPEGAMPLAKAAETLGVNRSRIYKIAKTGRLEVTLFQGRKYVTPEALAEYEATGRRPGRPVGYSPAQATMRRFADNSYVVSPVRATEPRMERSMER